MPQKKNPDVAELVRGKVGGIYGNLVALLTMMKGLPLAYNRDMQEDKKPLFESLDTTKACIRVMAGLVAGMSPRSENLTRSLKEGFIVATDIADYLSAKGMPFRQAHRITGEIVSSLAREHKAFTDLALDELRSFSELFDEDIFDAMNPASSVDRRKSYGGTARENVRKAIKAAREILERFSDEE
jgi:argininosuccinate lyase